MQQTTSGETPKKIIISEKRCVTDFIDHEHSVYENILSAKSCLYDDKIIVDDPSLNYLNLKADGNLNLQLKSIIYREFENCEKIYPYLGDFFIKRFFGECKSLEFDDFFFKKNTYSQFVETLKHQQTKDIFNWLMSSASLEYTVSVNEHVFDHISVEKTSNCDLYAKYDSSFLGGKKYHKMSEYKFIIIDGFIESVGEIHHLLDQAYKTKVPHVIFCFGMSDEVSHVIKYNNSHAKFEVFPFVAEFNENSINLLHDIAVLHQDQIVTSKSGQTISQAVRGDLKIGKEIIFHQNGFKIKPVADYMQVKMHRDFLKNRITESENEENAKLLKARLKAFSGKGVKIYLSASLSKNQSFTRELDYMLRFLRHARKKYVKASYSNSDTFFVPFSFVKLADKKVSSLKNTYQNIEKVIHYARP